MDNATNSILIVLKHDLDVLNRTVKNIALLYPENTNSWLFPTKNHTYVNEILLNKDLSNLSYHRYLELIVDRLYTVIRLISNYLEARFKLKANRLVLRPKQLSLGCSLNIFWRIIENISDTTVMETRNKTANTEIMCKESQTDVMFINRCDSCSSAMVCVKNIVDCLEGYNNNLVSDDREKIRYKLYDITQFGSMMKTTSSIEKSLGAIFEKLHSQKRENESLKLMTDGLKLGIKEKLGEVDLLKKDMSLFKEKYIKANNKILQLQNENEELLEIKHINDIKINTQLDLIKNLNGIIKKYQEKIGKMLRSRNTQNENINKILLEFKQLSQKTHLLETKCKDHVDNFDSMEQSLNKNDGLINNLNESVNKLKKDCSLINLRLQTTMKNHEEDSDDGLNRLRDIQEKMCEYIIKINMKNRNIDVNKKSEIKLKGNPIEDMTIQIEENKKSIKNLQDENDKLENIILKCSKINVPIKV